MYNYTDICKASIKGCRRSRSYTRCIIGSSSRMMWDIRQGWSWNGEDMKKNIRTITLTGMLIAVALVLGLTNIGIIPIPPANVTTMHIPVIIGAMLCGNGVGMILGLVFGLVSLWKAFTATSALVGPLLAVSPVYVIIMSVGARLMVPLVANFVFRKLKDRNFLLSSIVAPIAGTLTNTVLYLGLMLLFYVMAGLDSATVVSVILGVGALNGSLEALAAALICSPIVYALRNRFGLHDNKEVN